MHDSSSDVSVYQKMSSNMQRNYCLEDDEEPKFSPLKTNILKRKKPAATQKSIEGSTPHSNEIKCIHG